MFDWSTFLQLSEELVDRAQSDSKAEACWRSAVSRAYYCAFHCVLVYVQEYEAYRPPGPKQGDSHWHLIEFVGSVRAHRQHATIFEDLKTLRNARTSVDYHRSPALTQPNARLQIERAKKVVVLVAELRKKRGPPA